MQAGPKVINHSLRRGEPGKMFHVKHFPWLSLCRVTQSRLRQRVEGTCFYCGGKSVYIRSHTAIILQLSYIGTCDGEGLTRSGAGFEWQAEVEHLRGAHKFDSYDLIRLLQNPQHLVGAGGSH